MTERLPFCACNQTSLRHTNKEGNREMNKDKSAEIKWLVVASQETCGECGRVFNMLDEIDAEEATFGHDCETKEGN